MNDATNPGIQLIAVGDEELAALARLPDYERTGPQRLERQEGDTRIVLISLAEAAAIRALSEASKRRVDALFAQRAETPDIEKAP